MSTRVKSLPCPQISFDEAMRRFIITGRGMIGTVKECPAPAFLYQAKSAIATVPQAKQAKLRKELLELDYSEPTAKYHAIMTLTESRCEPFTFAFFVDDRNSKTHANSLA
jgi:hypothetical protein